MRDYEILNEHVDDATVDYIASRSPRDRWHESLIPITSFEHLDIEDIVDPYIMSPEAFRHSNSNTHERWAPSINDEPHDPRRRAYMIERPSLHVRTGSLVGPPSQRASPAPTTPLPPVPASSDPYFGRGMSLHTRSRSVPTIITTATSAAQMIDPKLPVDDDHQFSSSLQVGYFLEVENPTEKSAFSDYSDLEDESSVFHTAPGSPISPRPIHASNHQGMSLHSRSPAAKLYASTGPIRRRLRPLFGRGTKHALDETSDSEDDMDVLCTPTDVPALQHKRESSWTRIVGKLKHSHGGET